MGIRANPELLRGLACLLASLIYLTCLRAEAAPAAMNKRAEVQEITEVQRFAVIVGANAGGKDRAQLRYASTDAAALQSVLTQLGGVESR